MTNNELSINGNDHIINEQKCDGFDDYEFEQFINEGLLNKLFGFFKKILKKTNKDKLEIKDASKNLKKSKSLNIDALDNDAFIGILAANTTVINSDIGKYLMRI